jgi:hypothetical protein
MFGAGCSTGSLLAPFGMDVHDPNPPRARGVDRYCNASSDHKRISPYSIASIGLGLGPRVSQPSNPQSARVEVRIWGEGLAVRVVHRLAANLFPCRRFYRGGFQINDLQTLWSRIPIPFLAMSHSGSQINPTSHRI